MRRPRPILTLALVLGLLLAAPAVHADPLPLPFGEPVAGAVDDPAVPAVYTFEAAPGQKVYLDYRASSAANLLNWSLTDALGRVILANSTALGDLGPAALMGGTYTLTVSSEDGLAAGTFEFVAYAPVDWEEPLTIGQTFSGELSTPGQAGRYTVEAVDGQVVMLDVLSSVNCGRINWSLTDSRGRVILPRTASLVDVGPFPLRAGSHTLDLVGEGDDVGSWEVHLASAGVEERAIALDEPVVGEIAVPGERDVHTFDAAPGQR